MAKQQKPIELESLAPQEIEYIRKAIEEEIEFVDESLKSLQYVVNRFSEARTALQTLGPEDEGKDLFIPLTSSLYVPGKLKNVDLYKVDIGAGFLAEMSRDKAIDYYTRRITKLAENSEQLTQILATKTTDLERVSSVLQRKLQTLQPSN